MRQCLALVLCSLHAGALAASRGKAGFLTGEIVSLRECKDSPGGSNLVMGPNVTQYRGPDGEFAGFSTTFDLLRGSPALKKGHIKFDYCTQGVAKNCENFSNWRFSDGCALWVNKNTIWHKMSDAITPTFACPFIARHYTISNLTLDVSRLELLPVENREWRVTLATFGEDERVPWICAVITVKLYRAGRRRGPRT